MCDNAFPQLTIKAFWKSYIFNTLLYYFGIKLQENTLVNTYVFLMQSHKDAINGLFAIGAKPKTFFSEFHQLLLLRTPEKWNGSWFEDSIAPWGLLQAQLHKNAR